MKLQVNTTSISGCFEIVPKIFTDERGSFVKTFHQDAFREIELETSFVEEYFSVSMKGVLRGLHFQLPPKDCTKIVYCISGEVIDIAVDLRVGSPTYGKHHLFELNDRKANIIYLPIGIAHGFYVTSEQAIMVYKVSQVYNADLDTGIHWDSIGVSWLNKKPIVSKRDNNFVGLDDFHSPFIYQ